MEEKIKISILLNLYGNLLTKTQQDYMNLYYNEDFSLSEIGEENNITRQAVRTILLKSKKKLLEFEETLKFMQKEMNIKDIIKKLKETDLNRNQKQLVEKINNYLDY